MKLVFSILLSLSFLSAPLWQTDFKKAQEEALSGKKYILLNFSGSDWCAPCIKLKRDILDTDDFLGFASEKLVLVRADFPRLKKNQLQAKQLEQNEILAEKYNNEGKFPFTVLLDAKGHVIKEWEGYPPNLTVESLKSQIQQVTNALH